MGKREEDAKAILELAIDWCKEYDELYLDLAVLGTKRGWICNSVKSKDSFDIFMGFEEEGGRE